MTLKDVAEKAGVSVSTVSRVIASSNEKCASEEVKKRIWKAVQEPGYRPNQAKSSARRLSAVCLHVRMILQATAILMKCGALSSMRLCARATGWASSLPSTTPRKWPRETTARDSGTALL